MNSSVHQSILESNVKTFVQQLKLGPNWVIQQDNDPQTQQQIYNRRAEKEKNQDVALVESKLRPQPDWKAVEEP